MLGAQDLAVEVGGKTVVSGATFTVATGDKVGLVGRNGAGKTSLFRVLGGDAEPTAGTVRKTGAVGYLSQDPRVDAVDPSTSSLAHVLSGRGLAEAETRLEKLRLRMEETPSAKNVERYTRAQERFEIEGGYAATSEVKRLAAGLGLGEDRLDMPIGVLSGGERRRVELARILFAGSHLLLLDEPTNHLDNDAKTWLMGFLRGYSGALLVISHDLDLLDESITRVLHLEREEEESVGRIVEYRGTYGEYLEQRELDEVRQVKVAAGQRAEIDRLSRLADSMRGSTAKRARRAKVLDKRVGRIESDLIDAPTKQRLLDLNLPDPPHCGKTVLEVSDLALSYGSLDVFEDVAFSVGRGERLLILGLNGAGKTSLLRCIAGLTDPALGEIELGYQVSMGFYAQEHEGIEAGRTLFDHVSASGGLDDRQARGLLGMFGLRGDKVFQDATTLSGGEKTKLALAQLVAGNHNLLMLDEPSNNLDPPSRSATATALAGWKGAMMLVSHDQAFVKALRPDRVLMMPDGTLDYWSDDLLDLVAMA